MRSGGNKTEKNIGVELLRIFLTTAVCLHHFRMYSDAFPYGGAPPAVDCFFIISGYYLSKHLLGNEMKVEESGAKYIWVRYKKLLPDYFFAFAIAFISRLVIGAIPATDWFGYIREALMIEFWGIDISARINPPDWYCGYLLLADIIMYIYFKWMKKNRAFLYVTGILAVGIYFMFASRVSHINIYPQYQSVLSVAIFRAMAGLLLGCSIYLINQKTCCIIRELNNVVRYTLMLFLGVGLAYLLFWKDPVPYIAYVAILLFAILFYLTVSMEEKHYNIYFRRIIEYLGGLCFTVYLNHYLIAFIFDKYSLLRMLDWKTVSLCFLIVVFIFSNFVFWIEKTLFKLLVGNGEVR